MIFLRRPTSEYHRERLVLVLLPWQWVRKEGCGRREREEQDGEPLIVRRGLGVRRWRKAGKPREERIPENREREKEVSAVFCVESSRKFLLMGMTSNVHFGSSSVIRA